MPRDPDRQLTVTPTRKRVSIFLKIFVLLHLVAITSWSLPVPPQDESFTVDKSSARNTVRSVGRIISDGTLYLNQTYVKSSPLKFYLMFTGFWQYWDMFSPNPASIDFYGTATVTYKDGTTALYTFPRMYTLGIPQKYVSERYRKFYERAHTEDDRWLWPTFAQRIALKEYGDPNNPPVQVTLTRHFMYIAPPGKKQEKDYHGYNYFTYQVDQKRLKKDKAAGVFG